MVGEDSQVARLRGRIAAYIDHPFRCAFQEDVGDGRVDAGPRRVEHDDVGMSMRTDEIGAEHVFHVAGKELGIGDMVLPGVDLRILDGLGHILDTYDLLSQ